MNKITKIQVRSSITEKYRMSQILALLRFKRIANNHLGGQILYRNPENLKAAILYYIRSCIEIESAAYSTFFNSVGGISCIAETGKPDCQKCYQNFHHFFSSFKVFFYLFYLNLFFHFNTKKLTTSRGIEVHLMVEKILILNFVANGNVAKNV